MKLIENKLLTCKLNFSPQKVWPKNWPAFAWDKIMVAGFNSPSPYALNFSPKDITFLDLFHTCYPRLSLCELGHALKCLKKHTPKIFDIEKFFALYGFHQNTDFLVQQLEAFLLSPLEFQAWVDKKNVHLSELRPLLFLQDQAQEQAQEQDQKQGKALRASIISLLKWLACKSPSHSTGVKILELGVELILMGKNTIDKNAIDKTNTHAVDSPLKDLLKKHISSEELLKVLEKKRKPLTFARDKNIQKQLDSMIWPSKVKACWLRQGASVGLELKLWCKNQTELLEKTKHLESLAIFDKLLNPET